MLEVQGISFGYSKQKTLFDDVSFKADVGEFVVILGANGAGKSSLLNLISKRLTPTKGMIRWCGEALHEIDPKEFAKKRGVLTQFVNIEFGFSVFDVVLMGRYPHFNHQPTQFDIDVVYAAMEQTDILKYKDVDCQNLSGGEQQRVQLARVIAQTWKSSETLNEKSLLLLDEPVSSLDLKHQHKVLEISKDLSRNGYCVIAVLHDLNQALQYADRVIMMNKEEVMMGSPAEIITPENVRKTYGIESEIIQLPDTDRLHLITGIHANQYATTY